MLDRRQSGWTPAREEILRTLWAEGLSASKIAGRLGGFDNCMDGGRSAVCGKVNRLNLPGRLTLARKTRRYRSGPVSYEEKSRREAERTAKRMLANLERRQRKADGSLPPLVIVEPPAPVEFLNLTFDQLVRDSCRYPRGEGTDIRFCGQPKMEGFSYCPHCYRICHGHSPAPEGRNQARSSRLSAFIRARAA